MHFQNKDIDVCLFFFVTIGLPGILGGSDILRYFVGLSSIILLISLLFVDFW